MEKDNLPFYMNDIAKFLACFGLNANDLAHYFFANEDLYS